MFNNAHLTSPCAQRISRCAACGWAALVCALGLASCSAEWWPWQQQEEEWGAAPPLVVAPPPRVIRCRRAARNGELPSDEERIPQDYENFRSSAAYRTSLRTWQDAARLRSSNGGAQRCVVIELSNQRGQYFVDGRLAMDFPVCTGTPSHPTPTGAFRISEKDRHHRSNLYHCAMPLFMRLTNDGIGLHVGDVFRTPASHGCIRLTREACATLFRDLPHGAEVLIRP